MQEMLSEKPSEQTDENLIQKHIEGDKEAFVSLANRYLKPIFNFTYRLTGNRHDAEDITQEVFVKIWKNAKQFRPEKKFKTWIFAIAKNACLDFFKKKRTVSLDTLGKTLRDDSPLPAEGIDKSTKAKALQIALEKLPENYKIILLLHFNEDLTFREIAEIMEEPLNTIKSRHLRALKMIKKGMPAPIIPSNSY
jgi:RNA polymerase sigma-70 factor (ECF subfamily)